MNDEIKPWLQKNSRELAERVCADRSPCGLPLADIEDFISSLADVYGQRSPDQMYAIHLWVVRIVGDDVDSANEWLGLFQHCKRLLLRRLAQQFGAEILPVIWPEFDELFHQATIETARLAKGLVNTTALDQVMTLRRQMEEVERAKTHFIHVAAHELKTPLTLLDGYANILRQAVPEEESLLQMYIAGLDGGTQRLREIIEDMIDLSMIQTGSISIKFQLVYLDKLLDQVAKAVLRSFDQRQVGLVVEPSREMTPIYGDPERLVQVFNKIISNGLKYTPDGGQVTVRTELIRQAERTADMAGYVSVQIQDTGIGIAANHLERIFESFGSLGEVALHSSGKTKYRGGGPGLGLPIARGIVEAHGGRIWVESPGYDERARPGSTFHVELPCWVRKPLLLEN